MTDKNAKIVFLLRRFFQTASRYMFCPLILLPGLLTACAGVGEFVKADLGQEVSLRIGQTAQIENEQLAIRFNGIAADSRCPNGVTCVWTGEINCNVVITYKGSSSNITLTQPGLTEQAFAETYQGYRLIYSVQPYPEAGKQISAADYRLILTVEKLSPSPD
jgi:hypothetical protein